MGGKGRLLKQILPLIPYGDCFCELFGGAAAVLTNRERSPNEVYNDLDGLCVNFFRCLQDPRRFRRLRRRLRSTPYAVEEFVHATELLDTSEDPDELAWAFFVGQNQVVGGMYAKGASRGNWGRGLARSSVAGQWVRRVGRLKVWRDRMMGVQIDNKDALECLAFWDTPQTVFYLDPPYAPDSRRSGKYGHETTSEFHARLVEAVLGCKGAVCLSGYASPIYAPLGEAGWDIKKFRVTCGAGRSNPRQRPPGAVKEERQRTEILWRNPRAVAMAKAPVQAFLLEEEEEE